MLVNMVRRERIFSAKARPTNPVDICMHIYMHIYIWLSSIEISSTEGLSGLQIEVLQRYTYFSPTRGVRKVRGGMGSVGADRLL